MWFLNIEGKNMKKYLLIGLGSCILAFGLYNIHYQSGITEGGVLGLILWLKHTFNISPAISGFILDASAFLIGFKFLGLDFIKYSLMATTSFSLFYGFIERFDPTLPSLINYPFAAAIIAGLFVGVGVGIVVRIGGACGGDDSLALTFNKLTKKPIAYFYFASDTLVLLLSLTYISIGKIFFSFITVIISSFVISLFHKKSPIT